MIAPQKQKRVSVSTQKSKKNVEVSEPIPIQAPIPTPVVAPKVAEPKPPSYRQRLIERIGIDQVRERERLSRQATKERKAQAIAVA